MAQKTAEKKLSIEDIAYWAVRGCSDMEDVPKVEEQIEACVQSRLQQLREEVVEREMGEGFMYTREILQIIGNATYEQT